MKIVVIDRFDNKVDLVSVSAERTVLNCNEGAGQCKAGNNVKLNYLDHTITWTFDVLFNIIDAHVELNVKDNDEEADKIENEATTGFENLNEKLRWS